MTTETQDIKHKREVFIETDIQLLADLANKNGKVINNATTNGITPAMRTKAWDNITKEFNASRSGGTKTTEQLKTKYKKMKVLTIPRNPQRQ